MSFTDLVELVQCCDGLNNVVVITVDRELNLAATVRVAKTKLRLVDIALLELLQQLARMHPDTS